MRLLKLSLFYLSIYVGITLLFAGIYRFTLTDSFYQANPETDPTFNTQIEEFLSKVCGHIKADTKIISDKKCIATFKPGSIKFIAQNLIIAQDVVSIGSGYGQPFIEREITSVMVEFHKLEGSNLYLKIFNFNRVADGQHGGNGEGDGDLVRVDINKFEHDSSIELEIIKPSSTNVFFKPADQPTVLSLTEYLARYKDVFDEPLYHYQLNPPILRLNNRTPDPFFNNFKSFLIEKKSHKETSFLKMLYFSGVTIATIGYGDIVPVSWAARILTILEAIIGIILLAILGASIYDEISKKK